MVSIDEFLSRKKIKFKSEKAKIAWFQKLRAQSLVKLGATFFINEKEAEILLTETLMHKIKIKKQRANQARINFGLDKNKRRRMLPKREDVK